MIKVSDETCSRSRTATLQGPGDDSNRLSIISTAFSQTDCSHVVLSQPGSRELDRACMARTSCYRALQREGSYLGVLKCAAKAR